LPIGPDLIVSIIIWGLAVGSIYTLLATGLNVIFGVMKVVNFAHGELMIVGAYLTFWLWSIYNLNPYVSVAFSAAGLFAVGVMVERLGFRPIKGSSKVNEIFLSLGLIFIIQNLMAYIAAPVKPVRTVSPYEGLSLPLGIVNFPYEFIITFLTTVAILTGLYFFLRSTRFGRSVRGVSQNRLAAMLMGINVEKVDVVSFGLGAALAGVAGALFGMLNTFDPYSGTVPAVKAFAVIILGGLGSIPGAVIGGFLYGITESSAAFILGGSWRDATAFALLTIVLVIRPEGLFGKAE
jgi:branched-chain amino acid transport system permease protein